MKKIIATFITLASLNAALLAADATFKVSEFTFTKPAKWESVQAGGMRAAQFKVPDAKFPEGGEVVFFYFGGGGAGGTQANVNRWFGQFVEPRSDGRRVEARRGFQALDVAPDRLAQIGKLRPIVSREARIDLPEVVFGEGPAAERRCFAQLAGAGLDARAIELVNWGEKKVLGPLAYVLAGFKALTEEVIPLFYERDDDDGLPDAWERTYFGNLSTNGAADPDGDGYTNLEDYLNWLAKPHHDCTNGEALDMDLNRHTRGRRDVELPQQVGHHGAGSLEIAPAVAQAIVGLDGDVVQAGRKCRAQGGKEILVLHCVGVMGEMNNQSSLAPEALTTEAQRRISLLTNWPNAGPVTLGKSAPLANQAVLISSAAATRRTSSRMRAWTSAVVPRGAHSPYQVVTV